MFNYNFILKLIKRLLRPIIVMFFVLLLSFLIVQISSYGYSVDGHELTDLPERFVNYLHTIPEYDNPNYSYFMWGLNGVIYITTFETPQDFTGYLWYTTQMRFKTNSSFTYKQYSLTWEGRLINTTTASVTPTNEWGFGTNNDGSVYFMANFKCYDKNSPADLVYSPDLTPYITNSSSDITSWSFDVLSINCVDVPTTANCWLQFEYGGNMFTIDDSNNYKSIVDNTIILNIPKSLITNQIVVRDDYAIHFYLNVRVPYEGGSDIFYYDLGVYTLDLTNASEINEDSNKEILGSIEQSTAQTVGAINNQTQVIQQQTNVIEQQTNVIEQQTNAINTQTNAINTQTNAINTQTNVIEQQTDFLSDDTISDDSIYLPQDDTNDITQDGLNTIFTTIYNAFCSGQAQDVVFPIPFTGKNIRLPANYVHDMLQNNNAGWVITFVSAFWWYLISRFIIKDITNKITKIKSGNIEDIETNNIKGDML